MKDIISEIRIQKPLISPAHSCRLHHLDILGFNTISESAFIHASNQSRNQAQPQWVVVSI